MSSVVVRMYNVGFGDAFLLRFPGPDRPRHALIDCGTLIGGAGPKPMGEVVEQIISDCTDADGVARIDLVVGTHRHHDHVSGFSDQHWADVEVGEVWMPWTEDPRDPLAKDIRETQSKVGLALQAAAAADPVVLELAENALSNAAAMATLHRGFRGDAPRHFLPGRGKPRARRPRGLPGVRVHVLGPSRDPEVIRDMDPPDGKGYLRLDAGDRSGTVAPFSASWDRTPADLIGDNAEHPLRLEDWEIRHLRKQASVDLFSLAVALDKAVNGTSLVLVVEVGDAVMLFPGDAQWGTWNSILENPGAMELIARTTFWKLGHHGSHNATPKALVAAFAQHGELWSMVSTQHVKKWPEIPKDELVAAVTGLHGHFARSDRDKGSDGAGFSTYESDVIEAEVPI